MKQEKKLYYCKYCRKILIREDTGKSLESWCNDYEKNVRLKQIKISDIKKMLKP